MKWYVLRKSSWNLWGGLDNRTDNGDDASKVTTNDDEDIDIKIFDDEDDRNETSGS